MTLRPPRPSLRLRRIRPPRPIRPHARALSTSPPPQAHLRPLVLDPSDPRAEELEGAVLLTMDREKARNSLSVQMVAEMREGIARASASPSTRILLLTSAHAKIFCAGADLRERRTMSPTAVSAFLDSLRSLMAELEELRVPTIGVVDGYALGGGLELALSCDLRVAGGHSPPHSHLPFAAILGYSCHILDDDTGTSISSSGLDSTDPVLGPDTLLSLPETKLGIIPGAGGTQRLTRVVGPSRAMDMIYTGRRVGPDEAEAWGLVNRYMRGPSRRPSTATPGQTALDGALDLARQVLTSAPLALTAAKTAIRTGPALPLQQALDLERALYDPLLGTVDRQEGLRAFMEKRRARFKGC